MPLSLDENSKTVLLLRETIWKGKTRKMDDACVIKESVKILKEFHSDPFISRISWLNKKYFCTKDVF